MTIAAAIVLCCGCGPLHEDSGCPRPCPSSCATSCFPTGFCRSAAYQPEASPPVVREQGTALRVAFGDLPPGAGLDLTVHAVIDLVARGETIPWDYAIRMRFLGPDIIVADLAAFNAVDFPVLGDWSGTMTTDSDGLAVVPLHLERCSDRPGRAIAGCIFLHDSSIVARVRDASRWEETPACR